MFKKILNDMENIVVAFFAKFILGGIVSAAVGGLITYQLAGDFDPNMSFFEKLPDVAWAMLICGLVGGLLIAMFCNRNRSNQ